jgi:hypothetical protein
MTDKPDYLMPDAHAAWIGRIAETWAQLEFNIDRAIWALCPVPDQLIACVTSQLIGTHTRMNAFVALSELCGAKQPTVDEIKTFWSVRINPLVDKRNRAVHDPRMQQHATGTTNRLQITAKPRSHFAFVPESISDLKTLHSKIYATVVDFIGLRWRVITEIRELPAASRPTLATIVDHPHHQEDQGSGGRGP